MFPPPNTGSSRAAHPGSYDKDATPLAGPSSRKSTPQMHYFLTDEKGSMEGSLARVSDVLARHSSQHKKLLPLAPQARPNVEDLDITMSAFEERGIRVKESVDGLSRSVGRSKGTEALETTATKGSTTAQEAFSTSQSPSPKSASPVRNLHQHVKGTRSNELAPELSRPVTPAYTESPVLLSSLGSPISRLDSESELSINNMNDVMDHATISEGDVKYEQAAALEAVKASSITTSHFVMPSLSLPSRRPFTERGKTLGRLKIMIAGSAGVGKTSLIKAIYQVCQDIVHVDDPSTSPFTTPESSIRRSRTLRSPSVTSHLSEVYASTKAYPPWWSVVDDGKLLRRRKSMGDSVLERNLCFVDTPGYRNDANFDEFITPIIRYIEEQLDRTAHLRLSDNELINMMSGAGGPQVDVVLYLIHDQITDLDIEYMRRLNAFTNVIPVLAKADSMAPMQISTLRTQVLSRLSAAQIRPFLFGATDTATLQIDAVTPPWTISSLPGSDPDTMDASLLMSPDYVSPLMVSQLSHLVEFIFDRDSISWLRYATARKFLENRGRNRTQSSSHALKPAHTSTLNSPGLTSDHSLSAPLTGGNRSRGVLTPYSHSGAADCASIDDRAAKVQLQRWMADLQQSLQNERLRFEAVAKGERALWLTERLSECVQDGSLVAIHPPAVRSSASVRPGIQNLRSARSATSAVCGFDGTLAGMNRARSASARSIVSSAAIDLRPVGSYSYKREKQRVLDEVAAGSHGARSGHRSDPLGLVKLNKEMKRKTWAVLRLVGGVGVLGGLYWWWARGGFVSMGESWGYGNGDPVDTEVGEAVGCGIWSLVSDLGHLVNDW